MNSFNELKEKYSALYEFELSRNRLFMSVIDIEAFGYEVACIINYMTIQGKMLDNIVIDENSMLNMYGIDEITLEEAIIRATKMNLLTSAKKTDTGYKLSISKDVVTTLRKEVTYRRIYPKLLERHSNLNGVDHA